MPNDRLPVSAEATAGPVEVERRSVERRNEDRRKIERIGIRVLLAILFAAAAVVLAIVAAWRQAGINTRLEALQSEQASLSANSVRLREELSRLSEQTAANTNRSEEIGRLSARVAELNESLESLRERAESGQRAVLRDEGRYLLEIGVRRLALERDVQGALSALQGAEERFALLRDPRLTGVRRRLALEIQSLRAFQPPDLAGITAKLTAAEDLAPSLPVIGAITLDYEPRDRTSGLAPGFNRAWQVVKSSMRDMISIRTIGAEAGELVSLEEQGVRRHHLQLLLFSARLAALRGDQTSFAASIDDARRWLAQMFDPAEPAVAGLARELEALAALNIAPALPDITGSLQLLDRIEPRPVKPP